MASPGGSKQRRPSLDSPTKAMNLSWIPDGLRVRLCACFRMDCSSACRIDVRVADYVEVCDDGRQLFHQAHDFQLVVDRDTTNLKDISDEITLKVNHGSHQGITLTFWNKHILAYSIIHSDSQLMDGFDLYWDIRRLPLIVTIYDTVPAASQQQTTLSSDDHLELVSCHIPSILPDPNTALVHPTSEHEASQYDGLTVTKSSKVKKRKELEEDEEPWIDDDEEYVGLNDEAPYMSDVEHPHMSDVEHPHMSDVEGQEASLSSDEDHNEEGELVVDDSVGCETIEHVTNLENPSIAVGVTFEDGDIFKRAIRQYAVLNEFEIAAPYNESTR
ncbi:unnamed protein product [Urochloa humidicola]